MQGETSKNVLRQAAGLGILLWVAFNTGKLLLENEDEVVIYPPKIVQLEPGATVRGAVDGICPDEPTADLVSWVYSNNSARVIMSLPSNEVVQLAIPVC